MNHLKISLTNRFVVKLPHEMSEKENFATGPARRVLLQQARGDVANPIPLGLPFYYSHLESKIDFVH